MPEPSVTIDFDSDPRAAAATRQAAFAEAAKQGYLAAAAHISFPGIGRLKRDGAGYRWFPLVYVNDALPRSPDAAQRNPGAVAEKK